MALRIIKSLESIAERAEPQILKTSASLESMTNPRIKTQYRKLPRYNREKMSEEIHESQVAHYGEPAKQSLFSRIIEHPATPFAVGTAGGVFLAGVGTIASTIKHKNDKPETHLEGYMDTNKIISP